MSVTPSDKPDLRSVPSVLIPQPEITPVAGASERRRRTKVAANTDPSKPGAVAPVVPAPEITPIAGAAERRRRRTKAPTNPDPGDLGVVEQVRIAFRREHRLAALWGVLIGGIVPVAIYAVGHVEVDYREWWLEPKALLVLGGLVFSAGTVFAWARLAFRSAPKALAFTFLLEGVMTSSSQTWLSYVALAYLIVINAIGAACIMALPRPNKEPAAES